MANHTTNPNISFIRHTAYLSILLVISATLGNRTLGGELKSVTSAIEMLYYKFTSEKYLNVIKAISSLE